MRVEKSSIFAAQTKKRRWCESIVEIKCLNNHEPPYKIKICDQQEEEPKRE